MKSSDRIVTYDKDPSGASFFQLINKSEPRIFIDIKALRIDIAMLGIFDESLISGHNELLFEIKLYYNISINFKKV